MGRERRLSINGRSKRISGASWLHKRWALLKFPEREVWNNSLPNTIGVTRISEAEAPSNITFLMCLGKFGRALRQDSKAMQVGCTASNWDGSFRVTQPPRSLLTAHLSLFSKAGNSNEEVGPRIESVAPSCGLGTLRWRMRVLFSLGSLLGEGNRATGLFSQRLAIGMGRRQL